MAGWITALKLVPWSEVIKATPQVMKAAQSMLKKTDAQEEAREQQASTGNASQRIPAPSSAGQLEQAQRQSLEIIEKLAQQNTQIVATVGALRTGAQRLAWACGILGTCLLGLAIYVFRL